MRITKGVEYRFERLEGSDVYYFYLLKEEYYLSNFIGLHGVYYNLSKTDKLCDKLSKDRILQLLNILNELDDFNCRISTKLEDIYIADNEIRFILGEYKKDELLVVLQQYIKDKIHKRWYKKIMKAKNLNELKKILERVKSI